jgi:FMN phosphatase YigB (HAD superfamily)
MNFIFDLYGTLIDIWTDESREELWEGMALLLGDGEENAASVREEYLALCRSFHKGGYHELNLLGVFEKMLENRQVDTSVAPSLASEFRRMSMVRLGCFRGVKTMLSDLKAAGGGVYLLSNARSCFTVPELHSCGLYDLFDGIVISSDIGVKKPSVEAFEIALKTFNIDKENSIYVGIHMNKFPDSRYSGLQVYYSQNAELSYQLALDIKNGVCATLQPQNKRQIKAADSSIYILHNTSVPAVLIECGFLSNEDELASLKSEDYQRALAINLFSSLIKHSN